MAARHLHQHVVIGRKATTVPRVALADPDLFASEEYVFTLERSRYTDKCEITTRLAPGLNEIELPLEWQARLVSLSFVSVANYVVDAAEVHRRIKDFMQSNDVVFDGAGDTELALPAAGVGHQALRRQPPQAEHGHARRHRVDPQGVPGDPMHRPRRDGARARGAAAARRLPGPPPDPRRAAVHGLAGGGARPVCSLALEELGVAKELLDVTFHGRAGHLAVDFIPHHAADAGDTQTPSGKVLPLPAGIPFELLHKASGARILPASDNEPAVTLTSGTVVACPLPSTPRSSWATSTRCARSPARGPSRTRATSPPAPT